MKNSVPDTQDSGKKSVCAVWGKHMWFCVQNSGYQYTSACLTGTEWLGYCSSLFWLWAVRGDGDAVGIFCILRALGKEQKGGKQLEGPVLTHCPFSPCKFWGEGGDKSSGTKDKLDPMGWWSRAKSIFTLQIYFIFALLYFTLQIYFDIMHTVRQEEVPYRHLFVRKIKK